MLNRTNSKFFKLAVGKLKKDSPTEIVSCCPMCGDTKNRLHLYSTEVGDLVHCFNDGCELADKHHSMRKFLEIISSPYVSSYKRETLSNTIDTLKNADDVQDILARVNAKKATPAPQVEIPLAKLFGYAKDDVECSEYLKNRKITVRDDWFFSKQKFFEFQEKKVYLMDYLLIPIYDENYKYKGFYSRSIKEKSFSTFLLDGTEKIWRSHPDQFPDIITEGIFDAISSGFENSAAMLSASVSQEYRDSLPKSTIFAFDSDETGMNKAIQYVDYGFQIFVWPEGDIKDFNDLVVQGWSREKIKAMIKENTYSGIVAKTRLKMREI